MSEIVYIILKYNNYANLLADTSKKDTKDISIIGVYKSMETGINLLINELYKEANDTFDKKMENCNDINTYIDETTFQELEKNKDKYSTIEWQHIVKSNEKWNRHFEDCTQELFDRRSYLENCKNNLLNKNRTRIDTDIYEIKAQILK